MLFEDSTWQCGAGHSALCSWPPARLLLEAGSGRKDDHASGARPGLPRAPHTSAFKELLNNILNFKLEM